MNNTKHDPNRTFTAAEIKKALTYMMINELSQRSDGKLVDFNYINGFAERMFHNIDNDRKRITQTGVFPDKKIVDAWSDGKRIQAKHKNINDEWFDLMTNVECHEIIWHADQYEYRIKTE